MSIGIDYFAITGREHQEENQCYNK
jgi:hypothetical protein